MQEIAVLVTRLVVALNYVIQFSTRSDRVVTLSRVEPERARFLSLAEPVRRSVLIGSAELVAVERVLETFEDQPPDVQLALRRLIGSVAELAASDDVLALAAERRRRDYPGILEREGDSASSDCNRR